MGDTKPDQSGTGSAPLRPKRSETRFCRTPQWLYGTGISLQAIAAYGWLHGKYGYLPRINPSYATLAEELGVSRGSVITYFKELVGVGAVRVTVGGPKGRTINSYEIAFDAPFAFPSGQPADHSETDTSSVVSPLTTTSQPADQTDAPSGQRAVPDKEAFKNPEDSLSSPASPDAVDPPVTDEREIFSDRTNGDSAKVVAAWLAARGGRRNPRAEAKVRTSAASLLAVGRSIPDVIAIAEDMAVSYPTGSDLAIHDDHFTAQQRASPVRLAKWCGCGGNPAAEFNGKFRTHNGTASGQPCLICHPDALQESA